MDGDIAPGTPKMTSLRYYDSGGYTGWRGGWQMNRVGYLRSYIPRSASGEGDPHTYSDRMSRMYAGIDSCELLFTCG